VLPCLQVAHLRACLDLEERNVQYLGKERDKEGESAKLQIQVGGGGVYRGRWYRAMGCRVAAALRTGHYSTSCHLLVWHLTARVRHMRPAVVWLPAVCLHVLCRVISTAQQHCFPQPVAGSQCILLPSCALVAGSLWTPVLGRCGKHAGAPGQD
jgi:hypothetical protein